MATDTQAVQSQNFSACPASVIKTGSPEHRAESPTSHWRGWEASPLRRRRKETWVCFLGSANKPERRERVNTRLSKAFQTKPVQCDLDRQGTSCRFLRSIGEGSGGQEKRNGQLLHGRKLPLLQKLAKWLFSIQDLTGHCCRSCCSLSLFSPGSCYPSSFSSFSWSPPFCRKL